MLTIQIRPEIVVQDYSTTKKKKKKIIVLQEEYEIPKHNNMLMSNFLYTNKKLKLRSEI